MGLASFSRGVRIYFAAFLAVGFACVISVRSARAQDPFEIRVEQYESPQWGSFTFEEHLNDVASGTTRSGGSTAPTHHQFRMSSELTAGITDHLSLGSMLMTAVVPGRSRLEYAGWRVLPHFYAPDSWLPFRLGLTAEFSFQRTIFDESSHTLELRTIIEKKFGHMQFDANPSFERSLSRKSHPGGWNFEPSLRLAYDVDRRATLSFEYFGGVGAVADILPVKEQVHQVYPGVVVRLPRGVIWDVGVGAGLTSEGDKVIAKTRIEFQFGRKEK